MRLKDKVAIITGAGTGIGEAIAHKFSREGAAVLLAGLPSDPVKEVAETIVANGGKAETFLGDLADEAQARACVAAALRRFGQIHILVNNAGIFIANAETDAYRIEDFERTIRSNIRTAFLMTKFALPHLQQTHGNILFTGSEAGINGSANFTPYGASKAFLHLPRCHRYGVDARTGWPLESRNSEDDQRDGSARAARHPGRDGQYFCVSGLGRGELCDGRAAASRRWRHAGQRHGRRIGARRIAASARGDTAAAPFA